MPNIQPIFSRVADIQGGQLLITAAADTTGQNVFNQCVATADANNGGYFQRLRFKATGTVVATVCRIYINNGLGTDISQANVPQTLTGTPSGTGGSLQTANISARVAAVDQFGAVTAFSTESANIAVSTSTNAGSILFNWNASSNSNTYILVIGATPGAEERIITNIQGNTYTMTAIPNTKVSGAGYAANGTTQLYNNFLYGEVSLPAVTGTLTAGTQDIDYPLNFALPPAWRILCGLGTTTNVSNGWIVTAIGGKY